MAGHVFVCHSSRDRARVEPLVRFVETAGWKCWMAPRDVPPGVEYAQAIVEAIDGCGLMLFAATAAADASPQVRRELERATSRGTTLLVARLEDYELSKAVQYYVGQVQWLELWQRAPEDGREALRRALADLSRRGPGAGEPAPGGAAPSAECGSGATLGLFEPERPVGSRPVPTWAWALLLGLNAWLLAYLLAPTPGQGSAPADPRRAASMGARLYGDACARCHGEDGNGALPRVPALRDGTRATAADALHLLQVVVVGAPGGMMPAWGVRLTNEELIAVVNHVRGSWGHDGRRLTFEHRAPPAAPVRTAAEPAGAQGAGEGSVARLEADLARALAAKDVALLRESCFPERARPVLFRTDGILARGAKGVVAAWEEYFQALGRGRVGRLQLIDARYDYDPAQVSPSAIVEGAVVLAAGRLFLSTITDTGAEEIAKGRFLRAYRYVGGRWALELDFADVPMALGVAER